MIWLGKGRKLYAYNTKDRSIDVNTVVLVPVGEAWEVKPAIVSGVYCCPPTDFPKKRIKTVICTAGTKDSMFFDGIDMRRLTAAWNASENSDHSPIRQQKKQKEAFQPYTA